MARAELPLVHNSHDQQWWVIAIRLSSTSENDHCGSSAFYRYIGFWLCSECTFFLPVCTLSWLTETRSENNAITFDHKLDDNLFYIFDFHPLECSTHNSGMIQNVLMLFFRYVKHSYNCSAGSGFPVERISPFYFVKTYWAKQKQAIIGTRRDCLCFVRVHIFCQFMRMKLCAIVP